MAQIHLMDAAVLGNNSVFYILW